MSMQVLQQLLTVPLQAQLRLGWVAAGDLVRNAVNTALVVAVVLAGGGIVPLLAVITPAGLAAVVLITGLIRGSMPLRRRSGSEPTRCCCERSSRLQLRLR